MRKYEYFLYFVAVNAALFGLMFVHAGYRHQVDAPALREMSAMVKTLELTDLCLFTEARYTRHPSMADRHSAMQDHPMSLEHFPSGSILGVPPHLRSQKSEVRGQKSEVR